MRILLVSQYYYPERNSNKDIAEGLVKLGHKVSVLTAKPNYGFQKILPEYKKKKYEIINGVEVFRVNLFPRKYNRLSICLNYLSFYFNARKFARHFKQEFDIVLSISLSPVISISPAIIYAKKHHVPHVLICEDLWPESTVITNAVRFNSLIYKILYRWSVSLYKNCDKIIVSSPSFVDYFKDILLLKEKDYVYINQPIILSENKEEKPIIYKHKYNIVYAGNLGKIQLTDKLVEAMKLLKDKDICLHLMGMGSELNNILNKIKNENLDDYVIYHGALPIEKAEAYYFNADALVVSLLNSGYVGRTIPNKAIQYLKYGRPILGIIQGDAKELLTKANGTIFSSERIIDIAESIDKIVHLSKEEKEMMGSNNKNYFINHLSADKIVNKIEKELISLLNN